MTAAVVYRCRARACLSVSLAAAVVAVLTGCGSEPADTGSTEPAARTLPDGRTATPEQEAFLADVEGTLSEDHQRDVLFVLSEGESLCRIGGTPDQLIDLMMLNDKWTVTEATAMTRASAEHLCPEEK